MAELADAPDSKSGSFGSPGSNPGGSTNDNQLARDKRFESSLVVDLLRGGVLVAYLAHNQMTWSELHYACAIQRQTKKHRV